MVCWSSVAPAAIIAITPSSSYSDIEAAGAGDEVVIAPGTYTFRVWIQNSGTPSRPIIIRAQDAANPPVFDFTGAPIDEYPGRNPGSLDAWRIDGSYVQLWNLRVVGVSPPDSNSTAHGMFFRSGTGLLAVGLNLLNCDVSIRSDADDVTIEHATLVNGAPLVNHLGGNLVLRYSHLDGGGSGSLLFSEGASNTLEYNWFMNAGSFPLNFSACYLHCGAAGSTPTTKTVRLRGNVILESPNQSNKTLLVSAAMPGGPSTDSSGETTQVDFAAQYNTLVGIYPPAASTMSGFTFAGSMPFTFRMENNVFFHLGSTRNNAGAMLTLMGSGNWAESGTNGSMFGATGVDPGFADASGSDYRPAASSALIGAAAPGNATWLPTREYYRDAASVARYRDRLSANDVGAFEFGTSTVVVGQGNPPVGAANDGGAADAGMSDGKGLLPVRIGCAAGPESSPQALCALLGIALTLTLRRRS